MKYGQNTFKCTYTPDNTTNYKIVTGLDVTIKVTGKITEKLTVNIEKYITKMSEDGSTIYLTGIEAETSLEEFQKQIKTNGTIDIYEKNGTKATDMQAKAKTGMKLEIKKETEKITYILVVTGDNNGDGKFNSVDLLKLARYLADLDKNLEKEYLYACDVHKNEKVNQADLLKMARVMSGLDKF